MIRKVAIRRFKRLDFEEMTLPSHVVLAGPNNGGKTSILQAIGAWHLALARWRELNDFNRRKGFRAAPIARQAFSAVSLRALDLLWPGRKTSEPIEIDVSGAAGWSVPMRIEWDTTEQLYVRPAQDAKVEHLREAELNPVFVPPMSGLSIEEPVYRAPKITQLLAQARPGEVLRNLLVEAAATSSAWDGLRDSIRRLFGYELRPPDATGANILAEYGETAGGPSLDIASAGSGFQQVLMLLAFLHARPGSVLLLDEPDAHLHVILQDVIYGELRRLAAQQHSQLIMATHSEVIINSVDPSELCVVLAKPRMLAGTEERRRLVQSLGALSNTDVMLAEEAPGVLYLGGYTDLECLRAWARVLRHPAEELLTTKVFWRPEVAESRLLAPGIKAERHFECLKLVRSDLPGLWIMDREGNPNVPETEILGSGLQRVRWRRYEIESYLVHPEALARFCSEQAGGGDAGRLHHAAVLAHFADNLPPAFVREPLAEHEFLAGSKAREALIPAVLSAGGLPGFGYTEYHRIAAAMGPEEVHPEVVEKLDSVCKAFGR